MPGRRNRRQRPPTADHRGPRQQPRHPAGFTHLTAAGEPLHAPVCAGVAEARSAATPGQSARGLCRRPRDPVPERQRRNGAALPTRDHGQVISLPQMVKGLAPYLIGWRGYFGFCQTPRVLTNLEAWIRRRLRSYLWRQRQNGRNRFKELRRRGVPTFLAAVAAGSPTGFWRMSGHPAVQQALRNPYFDGLGLPRLSVPAHA